MPKWYHVSHDWTKKEILVQPRVVDRVEDDEPDTPRICVCPTVAQCIVAIGDYTLGERFTVYECQGEAVPAVGVFDSALTDEHWLLTPTLFRKVYSFKASEIAQFPQEVLCGKPDAELLALIASTLGRFRTLFKTFPAGINW